MTMQPISNSSGIGYSPAATSGSGSAVPPVAAAAQSAAEAVPSLQEVEKAVSDINRTVRSLATYLEFLVDVQTRSTVVKVVDTRTKEVLREFSTGKVLGIAKSLGTTVRGLLLEERA